ncbi:Bug family tripartite tricarboxylate transporter substrate binding protein [Pseudorhodoferax sp.]|uniref:Bug family tripartite tricarboxylate transporter substrate binding protein n=1 Tax=Pseudorhodoferax sp. TaxID=1993553 RepID=UPI002DD625DE|nr:tripartite tricarboxylate transporter substrate binding protein [Pseudorhodoferax sp.]
MKYLLSAVALAAGLSAAPAMADNWPSQPIRLLLPVAPGGSADASARLIQNGLQKILGQPIVIENRSGAAGTISTEAIARAKPDGYTLGIVFTGHAANPWLLPKLPYDSEKDFTPIAFFWRASLGISVHKDAPYRTLNDLVQAAKAKPGAISFATGGLGQATHIAAAQLESAAGITLNHVPYRGGSPAVADVVAGHVPVLSSGTGLASTYIDTGALRLLAVTSATRSGLYPQVPTVAEAGYKGVDMSEWYGFVGPANLPPAIVNRMNAAIQQVLQQPEVLAQFAKWDMGTQAMTPAEFGSYLAEQTRRMGAIVKSANIKAQ